MPSFFERSPHRFTTRRRFLQTATATCSGIVLSSCARRLADVSSPSPSASASPAADTLYIYTWSNYINEAITQRFTEQTGIKVVFDIYDSNETMLAKMQAGGGNIYSVLYPSDYMVQEMVDLDLLTPLDASRITGLSDLFDNWKNPVYDENNAHSVPFSWGTTGLLYNSELLDTEPEDWSYLWDEQSKLSRRMTLFNDVREVMGATLKSLGYSYNSTDPKEIESAYNQLRELKPAISSFTTDGWRDQILAGDLLIAMVYSVDAIEFITEEPALKYLLPASGSSLWTDTMAIPKTAPNAEAAYEWINFLYDPDNAAWVVNELKFATPSRTALAKVADELKENKILFPSENLLQKCEGIAPIGDAAEIYEKYWTLLTSA